MQNLNKRELATIVAALRYWKREGFMSFGHEQDIATNGGALPALKADEIDALCETLTLDLQPLPQAEMFVCPKCGNDDPERLEYFEDCRRYFSTDEDEVIQPEGDKEGIIYLRESCVGDGEPDSARFVCKDCTCEFDTPTLFTVEFA